MSENRQISDTPEWKLLRSLRQHVLTGRLRTFRRTRGLLKDIGASNWNKMKTIQISLGQIFSMRGLDVIQDCDSWDEPELYSDTHEVLTDLCSLLDSIINPKISLDLRGLEAPYQILKGLLRHIKTTSGSYDLMAGGENVNLFDVSKDMEKAFESLVPCNVFFQMVLFVPDEMQSSPGFTSWSADPQDLFRNHETQASHVLVALFAGLGSCKDHQLLLQLPVLYEAGSDFIAMPSPVDLFLSTCLPTKTAETKPAPPLMKRLGNFLSSRGVQSKEPVPVQSEPETGEIRISREWQEARVELLERIGEKRYRFVTELGATGIVEMAFASVSRIKR
ncbi:hypothetical protein B0I35DRAFT_155390 [Stachybotrys elegans]|uniref:Uncharacterized protein n=1 Tax=Stachybotrys elegans TaxID=80388 RepID=A0A8K0SHT1_9HYPO|nr:hypothetical protein B0I35DRAFT_155390 [Stachybotrys elegans]